MTSNSTSTVVAELRISASVVLFLLIGASALAEESLADRRAQIASLSLAEQQQLMRNQERFAALTEEQQARMRQLHVELTKDAESAKLRGVLDRYYDWLKTLSVEERAELAELNADQRIERIRQLIKRQREEHERRRPRFVNTDPPLPPEDAQVISRWFSDLAWKYRELVMKDLPQNRRKDFEELDEGAKRRQVTITALRRWKSDPIPVTTEDLDRLTGQLSPGTRQRLAAANSPQQKKRLAREWLLQSMMARMGSFPMRRSMVSSEDLERFFETELPDEDRQRLMKLPSEQMQAELLGLYWQHTRAADGSGFGPPRGRPEGRPFGRPDGRDGPTFGPGDHPPFPTDERRPPRDGNFRPHRREFDGPAREERRPPNDIRKRPPAPPLEGRPEVDQPPSDAGR